MWALPIMAAIVLAALWASMRIAEGGAPSRPRGVVMMVTGSLGGGKTLYTVGEIALRRLMDGQTVVTNFWMQLPEGCPGTLHVLDGTRLWEQLVHVHHATVCLDEVDLYAPAMGWRIPEEARYWCKMARHRHCDLVMCCQYPEQAAKSLRMLCHEMVYARRILWWHRAAHYDPRTFDRAKRKPLFAKWYRPNQEWASAYNTHEMITPYRQDAETVERWTGERDLAEVVGVHVPAAPEPLLEDVRPAGRRRRSPRDGRQAERVEIAPARHEW